MKIIQASYEILDTLDGAAILRKIELCGRVCYKSEAKITDESAKEFVRVVIERGHESVLEHFSFSVRFIVDRGVSHELVRHRIASFSQESTQYCCYGSGDGNVAFIDVPFVRSATNRKIWLKSISAAERAYLELLAQGWTMQEARAVLPNSLKTEVIMTANLREWRHFFKLRTDKAAPPQMREVTCPLLAELKGIIPVVFDDIEGKMTNFNEKMSEHKNVIVNGKKFTGEFGLTGSFSSLFFSKFSEVVEPSPDGKKTGSTIYLKKDWKQSSYPLCGGTAGSSDSVYFPEGTTLKIIKYFSGDEYTADGLTVQIIEEGRK